MQTTALSRLSDLLSHPAYPAVPNGDAQAEKQAHHGTITELERPIPSLTLRRGLDEVSVRRDAMSRLSEDLGVIPISVGVTVDLVMEDSDITDSERMSRKIYKASELAELDVSAMILTPISRLALDLSYTPRADGTDGGGLAEMEMLNLYRVADVKNAIIDSRVHTNEMVIAQLSMLIDLLVKASGPARLKEGSG